MLPEHFLISCVSAWIAGIVAFFAGRYLQKRRARKLLKKQIDAAREYERDERRKLLENREPKPRSRL